MQKDSIHRSKYFLLFKESKIIFQIIEHYILLNIIMKLKILLKYLSKMSKLKQNL